MVDIISLPLFLKGFCNDHRLGKFSRGCLSFHKISFGGRVRFFFLVGSFSLTELSLDDNMLRGSVPIGLGPVMLLNAKGNALAGSIPAVVEHLSNLACILLSANRLTACIPATLGP